VPKPKLNPPGVLGVAGVPEFVDTPVVEVPVVEPCVPVVEPGVVPPNPKLLVDVPLVKLKEDTVSPNPKLPIEPVLGAPAAGVGAVLLLLFDCVAIPAKIVALEFTLDVLDPDPRCFGAGNAGTFETMNGEGSWKALLMKSKVHSRP
jgi:hypothetical protein